jgi:GT2 family glycosyltransferase
MDFHLTVHPAREPRPLDPARPRVDVIVLNWNGREHMVECLDSLRALDYPSAQILVIDQGSQDGSQETVLAQYPEVTLLALDRNISFCRANNVAMQWALSQGADYAFLLNNDTTVYADCITKLVETAEADRRLGIVSPVNYRYYDPRVVDLGVNVRWWTGDLHSIRQGEVPPGTSVLVCDYTWGCAQLIRREVIEKTAGFDPSYVMYHEDADLCLRARRHGYLTATRLDAGIRHKLAVTNDRIYLRQSYYRLRNLWRLVMAHGPLPSKIVFVGAYFLYRLPRQIVVTLVTWWRGGNGPGNRPRLAWGARRP